MTTKAARKGRIRVLINLGSEALPPFASDAELAAWLGVDRSQLSRYRRGRQHPGSEAGWRLTGLQAVVQAPPAVLQPGAAGGRVPRANRAPSHPPAPGLRPAGRAS